MPKEGLRTFTRKQKLLCAAFYGVFFGLFPLDTELPVHVTFDPKNQYGSTKGAAKTYQYILKKKTLARFDAIIEI